MNRNMILLTLFALVYLLTSFFTAMVIIDSMRVLCDRSWIFIFWSWKSHGKSVLEKGGHLFLVDYVCNSISLISFFVQPAFS